MSWAGDDWTVGLSGNVLLKVQQLQAQNEKLNKEKHQRQLQLNNSEAALHKQKQKYDEVRVELAALHRELGGVREAAQAEAKTKERLSHDLQLKTGQVHSLEGQLESVKKVNQNLTQEIKRLEAELEKLQKENASGESMLFSTPCWNMSSPWDSSGCFRVESEGKMQHARQQLQFADVPKTSAGGPFSPFPQQPPQSPLRRHVRQTEPSTPLSMFPWEREGLGATPKGRADPSVSSGDVIKSADSEVEDALRNQIEDLRVRVSELKREAQLESERMKDVESRMAQANRELSTREQSLAQAREQLTRAQTRIMQETDRVQAAEQKVKHLQEELKCQRQNAESSRCNAEQRRRDMEREHQRDLLEQQRERQALEKQHQQESSRLNQEIQQARALHNSLQAQYDKVCLQKQSLERDLEDARVKLKNAEADLRESLKRETQTEAKLTEALRECDSHKVCLGQMTKQERDLQEEVKRLREELAEALRLIKELKALSAPQFSPAGESFSPSVSINEHSSPYAQPAPKKRSLKPGRTREEERMKYPCGREPGEGIDSEHIEKFKSEESKTCNGGRVLLGGSPGVKESAVSSEQEMSVGESTKSQNIDEPSEKTGNSESTTQKDLKKENAELREELKDLKYELQKRLDDLETQRRAETEARTKLKQLSRKHSTQTEQHRTKALELKDFVTKLETQLEQEKKENVNLRETLEKLQTEKMQRGEDSQLKEILTEMEQKKRLAGVKMMRMKEELEDLQRKLSQEREKEEEGKQMRREEGLKIVQLQEELDNLRKSKSLEEKISKDCFPVAYMHIDNCQNTQNKDLASSVSLWESVDLQNDMVSKDTKALDLIANMEQTKPTEDNCFTVEEASDLDKTTSLILEVEHLRASRECETEKAKLAQRKLEDLQKQVTTQTKHLTQAFESQSKHIENLLREVQDKDCTLQKQSEELLRCQEKICILEERNTKNSELPMPPEPSKEMSRDLSSDSVFSNTSISDPESDDAQTNLVENIFVTHSQTQSNTTESTDKLQATEKSKPYETSLPEAIKEKSNGELDVHENPTDAVERLSKGFQKPHNDLNVLNAQNSNFILEEDLQIEALKVFDEDVFVDKNTEKQSDSDEGLQNSSCLWQDEVEVLHENSKAEVQTLLEQIKTLQDQLQELCEENRTQAEELKIWKLSSSEETAGTTFPSTVLREFQIFLPCSPGNLHSCSSR